MLVARDALAVVREDLGGAADAAARLAEEHRATPMIGRTLLQQAVPTTFGLKAAGWMRALDTAGARLGEYRPAAQLGGPAGTLDGIGPDVAARYAAELGLEAPVLPWHTERSRIAGLAAGLGTACGAIAKAAGDVVLLAQTEVGEVRETAPGRSSSMPHKRNPVAAVSARACARQAPGLVATLLACMEQEHERAAGAWHAEWAPLRALLVATGSAAVWLRTCLGGLQVDTRAHARQPPRVRRERGRERRRARRPRALRPAGGVARGGRQRRRRRLTPRRPARPTGRRRRACRRPRARRSAP